MEMYSNYNMGAGYAVYLPKEDALKAQSIVKKLGFRSWIAGRVEKGPRQVVIKPRDIIFKGDSLRVRWWLHYKTIFEVFLKRGKSMPR